MARRFSTKEKRKGISISMQDPTVKRIKAPYLDNSELIKENAVTLVGRLTNPEEHRMVNLLPLLPRKWNLQGRAVGADLGHRSEMGTSL